MGNKNKKIMNLLTQWKEDQNKKRDHSGRNDNEH